MKGNWRLGAHFLHLGVVVTALSAAGVPPTSAAVVREFTAQLVDWSDWIKVEGRRMHLSPSHTGALSITVCADHFPKGSQGRENIEEAIRKVNRARNVGISIKTRDGAHLDPARLYAKPPADRYRIEYTALNPNLKEMNASGGAFHFGTDIWDPSPEKKAGWFWGRATNGFPSDNVVLAVHAERFSKHFNNPLNSGSAPSVGLFAHELGHSLHMGHSSERAFDQQTFLAATVWRGSGQGLTHSSDLRTGGIGAFTQGLLERFYPAASPGTDDKYQWYLHEILLFRDPDGDEERSANEVTPSTTYYYSDYNPSDLYYGAAEDAYFDCETEDKPVYVVQYSDVSNIPCSRGRVATRYSVGSLRVTLRHQAQRCDVDYVQYEWKKTLAIRQAHVSVPPRISPRVVELSVMVDADAAYEEYDETDNELSMDVTFHHDRFSCPGKSLPVERERGLPGPRREGGLRR